MAVRTRPLSGMVLSRTWSRRDPVAGNQQQVLVIDTVDLGGPIAGHAAVGQWGASRALTRRTTAPQLVTGGEIALAVCHHARPTAGPTDQRHCRGVDDAMDARRPPCTTPSR